MCVQKHVCVCKYVWREYNIYIFCGFQTNSQSYIYIYIYINRDIQRYIFKMKSPIVLILLTITSVSISISNKYAIAKSITQEEKKIVCGKCIRRTISW